jgi:hypothetical protein
VDKLKQLIKKGDFFPTSAMSGLTAILECLGQAEPPPQEQVKRFFVFLYAGPKKENMKTIFSMKLVQRGKI